MHIHLAKRSNILRSHDQGQKQLMKFLFLSLIKSRLGGKRKIVAGLGIEPGTPALLKQLLYQLSYPS